MAYIDQFISTVPRSPCRLCGSIPMYKKRQEIFGHGEYPVVGWIECACGIRTKEFIIDRFYGCADTPDTPVLFWNDLMSGK